MNDIEVSLITNTLELNATTKLPVVSLDVATGSAEGAGLIGATLNGRNIVEDTIAKTTTSNGIASVDNDIQLDVSECEEIDPTELEPGDEDITYIVVQLNGVTRKIALSNIGAKLEDLLGYDATKIQTLKNHLGNIRWETDKLPAPTIRVEEDNLIINAEEESQFKVYVDGVEVIVIGG